MKPVNNNLRIAVLSGGDSAEAEISRKSAASVVKALKTNFREVMELEADYDLWRKLVLGRQDVDVVFPVLHGGVGENGSVQGFLECLGIPYCGSAVSASAIAMDKILAKNQFRAAGLPVLDDIVCSVGDDYAAIAVRTTTAFARCVVKPATQGSALGISFCDTPQKVINGLLQALGLSDRALIERRFEGREITVAVLADPVPRALPPVEVILPDGCTFDFYHRYTAGAAKHVCPASLDEGTQRRVEAIALGAHRALGCRHYSRTDMLLASNGEVALLELNTIPGMTATSLYPDAARAAGISFEELVKRLVTLATSSSDPASQ